MDQPAAAAAASAVVVPASAGDSRRGTPISAMEPQENDGACIDGDESGEGKPGNAADDVPECKDVLETGGDAAAVAADGGQVQAQGQGQGQGQTYERKERPPRVGSVRQGRKEKRKAEWKAKKARMKETKLRERQQRCVLRCSAQCSGK